MEKSDTNFLFHSCGKRHFSIHSATVFFVVYLVFIFLLFFVLSFFNIIIFISNARIISFFLVESHKQNFIFFFLPPDNIKQADFHLRWQREWWWGEVKSFSLNPYLNFKAFVTTSAFQQWWFTQWRSEYLVEGKKIVHLLYDIDFFPSKHRKSLVFANRGKNLLFCIHKKKSFYTQQRRWRSKRRKCFLIIFKESSFLYVRAYVYFQHISFSSLIAYP